MMSAITPNVIPVGNPTFNRQQDQSGSSAISLAGGPVRGNNYIIDGVPITDLVNRAVIVPSLEAVQEVKVQINTYDAEAGRTGGGFFNTTAKSGSNNYHGNIFGFLRPSSMHMQLRNQSFIVRVRFRERLTAKLAKIASPARWKTHYLFFQMAIAGESRSAFIGIRKRN